MHILKTVPTSEIVIYRHHMVLGGQYNRFVPKELYYPDTGTAESAVGILKRTAQPGTVVIRDRVDQNPSFTWDYLLKHAVRQGLRAWQTVRVFRDGVQARGAENGRHSTAAAVSERPTNRPVELAKR